MMSLDGVKFCRHAAGVGVGQDGLVCMLVSSCQWRIFALLCFRNSSGIWRWHAGKKGVSVRFLFRIPFAKRISPLLISPSFFFFLFATSEGHARESALQNQEGKKRLSKRNEEGNVSFGNHKVVSTRNNSGPLWFAGSHIFYRTESYRNQHQ